MILPGAEPFLLPGGRRGVILIHGFTGLPAELLLLGQHLQQKGFTVLGVRLAGHGTDVNDMSHMTDEDWMDSVRDGYAILSGLTDEISVIGHSMGGLFAMLLGAECEVAKVVSIAAPIFIAPEQGLEALPTREASAGMFVPKSRRHLKNVPAAANKTYRKMPLVSVHELLDTIEHTKGSIENLTAPLLIIHSHDDHTADPKSAEYIYEKAKSGRKEICWFDEGGHLLPLTEQRDKLFERIGEFLLN